MVKVDEKIIQEWRTAVLNANNGHNDLVNVFRVNHPNEYKLFTSMYRKRTELQKDLNIFLDLNLPVYWITLTFNETKDKNKIESKRKEAERKLSDMCLFYVIVEEHGEENGRYHIHGFITFKLGFGFQDFIEWHSRQKIELLEPYKVKSKIRYLTNYMSKQVPRLRRSKMLCKIRNQIKSKSGLRRNFPEVYKNDLKNVFQDATFPI